MSLEIIILLIIFCVFLLMGIPVVFSLLVPSIIYFLLRENLSLLIVANKMVTSVQNYPMIALPLYILVAEVMIETGSAIDLFRFLDTATRRLRGGLAYANVFISLIFAGMSGAFTADVAGVGKIEISAMLKKGYPKEVSVGITGASACIGPIFPPSIFMILFAMISEESIGALFLGGIIPAFIMVVILCIAVYFWPGRRMYPQSSKRASPKELWMAFKKTYPALLTPVIILGGIIFGLCTPTEAAAVALAYALFLGFFVYRTLKVSSVLSIFSRMAVFCSAIFIMVASAGLFGWVLIIERVPAAINPIMLSLTSDPYIAMLIVTIAILFLGCFVAPTALMLVVIPFVIPTLEAYGVNMIQFGIVATLALCMGALTPPYGIAIYVLKDFARLDSGKTIRGLLYFLIPLFIVVLLMIFFPWLTLAIPNFVFGK